MPSRNPVFGWMLSVPAMLMYKRSLAEPELALRSPGMFDAGNSSKSLDQMLK
jgi:hypothetical protein